MNLIFAFLDSAILIGVAICMVILRSIRYDTKRGADSLKAMEKVWCEAKEEIE